MFGELSDGGNWVGGAGYGAGGDDGEETDGELERVGSEDQNYVFFFNTQMEKSMGEFDDEGFELRERESLAGIGVDESGFGWVRR